MRTSAGAIPSWLAAMADWASIRPVHSGAFRGEQRGGVYPCKHPAAAGKKRTCSQNKSGGCKEQEIIIIPYTSSHFPLPCLSDISATGGHFIV
jgi:hypothetical protein